MIDVCTRIKQLREAQNLSHGEIEKRTGLLRCYTSRVENGHTVPSVETLQKFASALNVPLYQLFYDGTDKPEVIMKTNNKTQNLTASQSKVIKQLTTLIPKMKDRDHKILLETARQLAKG